MSMSALNCLASLHMIIHSHQSDKITAWDHRSSCCRRYFQKFSDVFPFHSTNTILAPLSHLIGEGIQFVFSRVPGLRVVMENPLNGEGFSSEKQHDSALPPPYLQGNPPLSFFKWQVIFLWLVQLSQHIPLLKCKVVYRRTSINRI